jgi:hypothetical protein
MERQKLIGQLASKRNRLHKVLTDGGIRSGVVVSDLRGQPATQGPVVKNCSTRRKANSPAAITLSLTKNTERAGDPRMHQTRKGKQWYFGMKLQHWCG